MCQNDIFYERTDENARVLISALMGMCKHANVYGTMECIYVCGNRLK